MKGPVKVKITRTGFVKAPTSISDQASHIVATYVRDSGDMRIRASLRPMTYCGPGSGGDRGAWILQISGSRGCALHTIES